MPVTGRRCFQASLASTIRSARLRETGHLRSKSNTEPRRGRLSGPKAAPRCHSPPAQTIARLSAVKITQLSKCSRLLLGSLAMALYDLAALYCSNAYRAAFKRLGTPGTAPLPNCSRGAPLTCDSAVTPRQLVQRSLPADQQLAQPPPRPSDRSGCDTRWPDPSRAAVQSQQGRRPQI